MLTSQFDTFTAELAQRDRAASEIVLAVARHRGAFYDAGMLQAFLDARPSISRSVVSQVKAAVAALDTTSGLAPTRPSAFLEGVNRASVLGTLGAVKVSGNVSVGTQVSGATASWVGEQVSKPLTSMTFQTNALTPRKLIANVVVSQELADLSAPSALGVMQRALRSAAVAALDTALLDPASAAIAGVKPASLTNGLTALTPAGDFQNQIGQVFAAISGGAPSRPVLVVSLQTALRLTALQDLAGIGVGVKVTPAAGNRLIAIDADGVAYSDEGGEIRIGQPDLEMVDNPASPATAATVMTSTWQRNLLAVLCERWVNWTKRADAVAFLTLA